MNKRLNKSNVKYGTLFLFIVMTVIVFLFLGNSTAPMNEDNVNDGFVFEKHQYQMKKEKPRGTKYSNFNLRMLFLDYSHLFIDILLNISRVTKLGTVSYLIRNFIISFL